MDMCVLWVIVSQVMSIGVQVSGYKSLSLLVAPSSTVKTKNIWHSILRYGLSVNWLRLCSGCISCPSKSAANRIRLHTPTVARYLVMEKMTPEQRERIHIFSPFFYNRLSHGPILPPGCVAMTTIPFLFAKIVFLTSAIQLDKSLLYASRVRCHYPVSSRPNSLAVHTGRMRTLRPTSG